MGGPIRYPDLADLLTMWCEGGYSPQFAEASEVNRCHQQ